MMAGVEEMITAAEKTLGLSEPNYLQQWYDSTAFANNWAWCNIAVTYWAYHSGNQQAVCFGNKYAYTVAHASAFRTRGQWHTDAGIRRGDIVFFDWAGTNDLATIDHVGIVTGTTGVTVLTIEGNIGNRCARKVRYADTIVGYGRPQYATNVPAPKPQPPKPKPAYVPFPGESFFRGEPYSPVITAMGKRLVANGCGRYLVGPGPKWTDADRESYAAWQRRCGYSGADANGWPGRITWDKLKVPK